MGGRGDEKDMQLDQPDPRIKIEALGEWKPGGANSRRLLNHNRAGCPKRALIELYRDHLRCSHCSMPLTEGAARWVTENLGKRLMHDTTSSGRMIFVWTEGHEQKPTSRNP